ncbi:MAG: glycolate oxidase subunit GlcF [Gammaproteobacteria bacterium]|nr:glycolate oxidase subunit GlcF [Gammaproteobacteria bacterium]
MQTQIIEKYLKTAEGQEAETILRSCVHCGFCTATCPTYQLLGDELDGPRGRIYQMKQVLEGQPVSRTTQQHLDRCLSCRSCETTCPSGVQYGRLVDIGRHIVEAQVTRPLVERLQRLLLRKLVPNQTLFRLSLGLGRLFSPILPKQLTQKIPIKQTVTAWPARSHQRKMLVLDGCVQPITAPQTNAASARLLDRLGIQLINAKNAGCCGAVSHHLSAPEEALVAMRRNIDAWWPLLEQGVEAIISTASGCGVVLKEYGQLLQHDKHYASKAEKISHLAKDLSEILIDEDLTAFKLNNPIKVAFHAPCTLQHGQKIVGVVEAILSQVGYVLTEVNDAHLCCGSAGTYSILQSKLSQQLLTNKLNALQADSPEFIASANIGCQMHMATQADIPVMHWIELVEQAADRSKPSETLC